MQSRLTLVRLDTSAPAACEGPTVLGGLRYGLPASDEVDALGSVTARRLFTDAHAADLWCSEGPFVSGRLGAVRWRHNGHWLHGAIDLPERAGEGLEAITRQAYAEVFAVLRESGLTHLQRLWNYLPHINAEVAGMERYRQFNVGRQHAFIDDGRDVQHCLPAACALGTHGERLCIRFLAGRTPALPVENPRQVPAYRYPPAYGPRAPSFSRAALVDVGGGLVALLISGTASIVDHASVHPGDVQAQTRETLANLQAVIDAAQRRCSARFTLGALDCTVYVRHAEDASAVRATLAQAIGAEHARRAVYLQADVCRSELLVEIEAQAFAPGRLFDGPADAAALLD